MRCYGCGIFKEVDNNELYPYPDEDGITDNPILPLFTLECQTQSGYKAVVVCHECFHKLQPDLWIGENCWLSLNPIVPIANLPDVSTDHTVKSYPDLVLT